MKQFLEVDLSTRFKITGLKSAQNCDVGTTSPQVSSLGFLDAQVDVLLKFLKPALDSH